MQVNKVICLLFRYYRGVFREESKVLSTLFAMQIILH